MLLKNLLYKLQQIKSSFWFLPLCITLGGVLTALFFLYLDYNIEFKDIDLLAMLFPENAESARNVLSVIAGAMIGIAGTVFSITLVVLTLAASQYGPRLLRNFMFVTLNQVVLGLYIATFLYALIILNAVEGTENYQFVPKLSVLFALILSFSGLIFLIIFIHRVSMSIQPSTIITDLRKELEENISRIYPKSAGQDALFFSAENIEGVKKSYQYHKSIKNNKSGYIEYVDIDKILALASKKNVFFEILCKPGMYQVYNEVIAHVYFNKIDADESLDISKYFHIEQKKTVFQDTEFAIHQMVEVACKALSPGINDPYTAINCIDNLTSVMCSATKLDFPSSFRVNQEGELKLMTRSNDFEGFMNAAFNQIRQFGLASPSVVIKLMECYTTISKFAHTEEQHSAIKNHADRLLESAQSQFINKSDLEDLFERHTAYLETIT